MRGLGNVTVVIPSLNEAASLPRVLGNDPYELRIALPKGGSWTAVRAWTDRGDVRIAQQAERGVRVVAQAGESGEVSWSVEFAREPGMRAQPAGSKIGRRQNASTDDSP